MGRKTIQDVAKAANLSISTVNRALHEPNKVRKETLQAILLAANDIGFYGLGSIEKGLKTTRSKIRIGIQLLQSNRVLYRSLKAAYEASAVELDGWDIKLNIEHVDDLSPQNIAESLERLAEKSDVIGTVSTEHPVVAHMIENLADRGIKTFALISPLTARCNVGYVGVDNWKFGRTAAHFMRYMCQTPGKVALFMGNHRFRCQETNESSFRAYFREHPGPFEILDTQSTFESATIAQEITEELIEKHKDLVGIYVGGGGISGVCAAVRAAKRDKHISIVAHDLTDTTRTALLDGIVDFVIAQPINLLTKETFIAMIKAYENGPDFPPQSISLPFEIYTRENL